MFSKNRSSIRWINESSDKKTAVAFLQSQRNRKRVFPIGFPVDVWVTAAALIESLTPPFNLTLLPSLRFDFLRSENRMKGSRQPNRIPCSTVNRTY